MNPACQKPEPELKEYLFDSVSLLQQAPGSLLKFQYGVSTQESFVVSEILSSSARIETSLALLSVRAEALRMGLTGLPWSDVVGPESAERMVDEAPRKVGVDSAGTDFWREGW